MTSAAYMLAFGATGGVAVRLDCNRGRSTWTSSGPNALQFGPLALTRALCPDDSLHDHIVRQWENIRSYVLEDGHLFRSASGARYEGDDVLFWEARGEAIVSWMGVHSICRRR